MKNEVKLKLVVDRFGCFKGELQIQSVLKLRFHGDIKTGKTFRTGKLSFRNSEPLGDLIFQLAVNKHKTRIDRNEIRKSIFRHRIDFFENQILVLVNLLDALGESQVKRWCSNCNGHSNHREIYDSEILIEGYLCEACGWPTHFCADDECSNMATWSDLRDLESRNWCSECMSILYPFKRSKLRPRTLIKAYDQSAERILNRDDVFVVEKITDGSGPNVLIATGFLTAGDEADELYDCAMVAYPDANIYRIHWNAGEWQSNWNLLLAAPAAKVATKALKVLVSGAMVLYDFKLRTEVANEAGRILGELLAQTTEGSFVLIGHSLGSRVMVTAAETCADLGRDDAVISMHLLGAAIRSDEDFLVASEAVNGMIYNYHSDSDWFVLGLLYGLSEGGAAGYFGIDMKLRNVRNIDVTSEVGGHFKYAARVRLRG